jgi:hypothetical protein
MWAVYLGFAVFACLMAAAFLAPFLFLLAIRQPRRPKWNAMVGDVERAFNGQFVTRGARIHRER